MDTNNKRMVGKEKDMNKLPKKDLQSFNYHTHTALCGHADGTMREYIEKAIQGNIKILGFSDHVPNPIGESNPHHEMSKEDFFEKYIPEIEKLKEMYFKQIEIKKGLESEYYGDEGEKHPAIKQFREKTEPQLDYMILGQHFVLARDTEGHIKMPPKALSNQSVQYPIDYALTVVEAIKSGKFAYVAHPDIFLEHRDKIQENEKNLYQKNVKRATEMICETASQYHIPLEVNLGSIAAIEAGIKNRMKDGGYAYPVPEFWKVAEEKGCEVLIGIDAHSPEALREKNNEIMAKTLLEDNGINLSYLESFEPLGIGKETQRSRNLLESTIDLTKKKVTSREIEKVAETVQEITPNDKNKGTKRANPSLDD